MNTKAKTMLLTAAVAAPCSMVQAQTTLLDQQPSQAAVLHDSLGIESNCDNFVVPAAGAILDTVTWWGTWNTFGLPLPDTFDIQVLADNGGAPGAAIASFPGTVPTVTATGPLLVTLAGAFNPEYELKVNLPSSVSLTAGTYWLEIFSTNAGGGTDTFLWEMAPLDPINGAPCMAWSLQTPGVNWVTCTALPETDMALMLEGTVGADNTGSAYCFGDATGAFCPCAAFAGSGEGCMTTSGTGATLTGSGHADVGGSGFTLTVTGGPANKPGLIFQGDNQIANPIGDGILCATGNVIRYAVNPLDASGSTSGSGFEVNAASGQTVNYQYWFRDTGNPCGGGFNFTGAWTVTWL